MLGHDFNSWGMETCRGSIPPPWRFDRVGNASNFFRHFENVQCVRSSQLLKPSSANPFISGAPDIVQSVEVWHKQKEIEATKAHRNSKTEAHIGIGENAGHVSPRQTILHVSVVN